MRSTLPTVLRRRVVGQLGVPLFASEHEIVGAARRVLDADQRRDESRQVDELFDADATSRVVLGMEETLAALSEDRVQVLLIAEDFPGAGGQCSACGRLTTQPGRCPVCGSAVTPVLDLGDRAIQRALEQDAAVRTVGGEAAALLETRGGIGAWVRYAMAAGGPRKESASRARYESRRRFSR